jgi:transcriptional regulator with XRE-family HTH domain
MPKNGPGFSHPRRMRHYRRWQESLMSMMEPADEDQTADIINVGLRLRELRTSRGLSIRSLADLSGLNFNTLSLIENEKTSPSVSTLQQLALALQVPITAFFESTAEQKDVVFQKFGQRPKATFAHGSLEDLGGGLMLGEGVPLLLKLEPGAESGPDAIVHTGQEFVYCLQGILTYIIAGVEYNLSPGDCLIFQAHHPHQWSNRGESESRSILILCPADENDRSAEQHFKTGEDNGDEDGSKEGSS